MSLLKNDVTANNTIVLSVNEDRAPYKEYKAAVAGIKPGHLIKLNDAAVDTVRLFNRGAGKSASKMFAVENTRYGKTIDDAYSLGDKVYARICRSGDVVMAWLKTVDSEIGYGGYLCASDTAGFLVNHLETEVTTIESKGMIAVSLHPTTILTGVEILAKVQIL